MSAIAITETTYPIVHVHFQGASTVKDTQEFLARFDKWLSHRELFSIILRASAVGGAAPIGADRRKTTGREASPDIKQLARAHQTAIVNDSVSAEEHTKVHRLIAQWAKDHKTQITNYCVGMAMIIDSPDAFEKERVKISQMINGMFSCPGKAFKTIESAEQWIENLLFRSK